MRSLVEIFCDIDDFCQIFEPMWNQQQIESGKKKRNRQGKMSLSEIMTIVIHFHQSSYRTFKAYYKEYVCVYLRAEFPKALLIGGLSGPAATLEDWSGVYKQAAQAMRLAERLNLNKIVDYDRLGVYQLLAELENLPSTRSFYDQIIGPLDRYDQRHRSNLVQTITAYFNHHGNISQTAETLFIHRNTLLYRLDRIQEMTGQNLDDPDERLALQLALKLWQIRPNSEPWEREPRTASQF